MTSLHVICGLLPPKKKIKKRKILATLMAISLATESLCRIVIGAEFYNNERELLQYAFARGIFKNKQQ